MATQADVRRIALALPGAVEATGRFAFEVPYKGKMRGFAWVWLERLAPKKARVPNATVLAVRVASLGQKETILASDRVRFFTEPHYNGYPAVLVRLDAVTVRDLRILITEGWRCLAPAEAKTGKSAKTEKPAKSAKSAKSAKPARKRVPR
ncbi:MAG: hypothetical protein IPP20_05525 [Gemmatimonadetes bacterium]|nr:hypothetical protein [Gemmatimonadota bacterium]